MGLSDLDPLESGRCERVPEVAFGERAGDAAGPLPHVAARGFVHLRIGDHVGHRESAARPEDAKALTEDARLVAGEVDDAVGDDHVNRLVRQWDLLDGSLHELDVLQPRTHPVVARELEHLVSHVETVRLAARTDPPGGQQNVDPSSRAEIEHRFAFVELGDGRGVAASERREFGSVGQRLALLARVELGAERVTLAGVRNVRATSTGGIRGAAATRPPRGHRSRGFGVAFADRLADVLGRRGRRAHRSSLYAVTISVGKSICDRYPRETPAKSSSFRTGSARTPRQLAVSTMPRAYAQSPMRCRRRSPLVMLERTSRPPG